MDKVTNLEEITPKEIPFYNSAWHLSKIESPSNDYIELAYNENIINYVGPQREVHSGMLGTQIYYSYSEVNNTPILSDPDGYLHRYIFQTIKETDTYSNVNCTNIGSDSNSY